jgi:hypothetical protein
MADIILKEPKREARESEEDAEEKAGEEGGPEQRGSNIFENIGVI